MGPASDLSPFRDNNPAARPDERYRAVVRERNQAFGLVSKDGISWRFIQGEPIFDEVPFDTFRVPFWDDWSGQYVFYTRGKAGSDGYLICIAYRFDRISLNRRRTFFPAHPDMSDSPFQVTTWCRLSPVMTSQEVPSKSV